MLVLAKIVAAIYSDVVFITRRLRVLDEEEIFPLMFNASPENLAMGSIAVGGYCFVALANDGCPVAAFGATLQKPAIFSVWMFATDRWPDVALSVTRHIRRVMMPEMIDAGANRADCWSMDGHDVAHRWLEVLGARREATLDDYGPTRKKYHCYSWTRTRLERDGSF